MTYIHIYDVEQGGGRGVISHSWSARCFAMTQASLAYLVSGKRAERMLLVRRKLLLSSKRRGEQLRFVMAVLLSDSCVCLPLPTLSLFPRP